MKKLGFIVSAGGASCFHALELMRVDKTKIHIISDRNCLAIEKAKEHGISNEIIEFKNNKHFSIAAINSLRHKKCTACLLLYTRLVTDDLYSCMPTYNIHPSILPAFKGFNAIKQAKNMHVKYQGATLHIVNRHLDGGTIVGQTIFPVKNQWDVSVRNKLSFVQKTMLICLFIEQFLLTDKMFKMDPDIDFENFLVHPGFLNESLNEYFLQKFNDIVNKETNTL
jgi:phosphoribosylglycinamide formyltransferase 1